MMMLVSCFTAIAVAVALYLWRWQRQSLALTNASSTEFNRHNDARAPWLLSLLIVLISAVSYGQLGRFNDHQQQRVDDNLDYVKREQLQVLASRANSVNDWQQLATGYHELGHYDLATEAMTKVVAMHKSSHTLGLLATYQYYRDTRLLLPATEQLLTEALALNRYEPTALMLLANHAYRQRDYASAIGHWQTLLQHAPAGFEVQPIQRALANAQAKQAASPL